MSFFLVQTLAVKVPAPEIIQSLPPVTIETVRNSPDPWLAFLGTVILALTAVVIALITLSRVNRQITLAKLQLTLANEELGAVKADLEIATEMKMFALRSPQLTLNCQLLSESNQLFENTKAQYREVIIVIGIPNIGTKVSQDVIGELLFPWTMLFEPPEVSIKVVNGENYLKYPLGEEPTRISPGNRFERTYRLQARPNLKELPFLWRVYDAEYAYPTSEWGREVIKLNLPPTS